MFSAFECASLNHFVGKLKSEELADIHFNYICVGKLRSNTGFSVAVSAENHKSERALLTHWMDSNLSHFRQFRIWTNRDAAIAECENYFRESEQPTHLKQQLSTKTVAAAHDCDDCGRQRLQEAMDAMMPPSRCSLDRAQCRSTNPKKRRK